MVWHKQDLLRNIERIATGIAVTRLDGTLEYANTYLRRMFGARGSEPLELPFGLFENLAGSGGEAGSGTTGCRELSIHDRDGKAFNVLYAAHPLCDDAGVITHYVHFFQYLDDRQPLERLSRLAFYDSLTGLPNRNLFHDRLERALAAGRRNRSTFALLYIDIDHFKQVNDTCGHEAGDELLRQVAARLARSVRETDTVARWGGDEFVAILEGADRAAAAHIASKLVAFCGEPYVVHGRELRITLSVGASFYPRDGHDAATLLARADRAMYEVKARGRNGYRVEESGGGYGLTPA
jgi:diguanylate cyclase (GGDEF)-like protein